MNRKIAHNRLLKLIYSAFLLALALILPFFTGQIPQIGSMLCPMHIPALLCGFLCGWPWGLAVGLLAPVLRSLLFGMPPLFPTATAMAVELAAYGFFSGMLYHKLPQFKGRLYVILILSMIIGRVIWGFTMLILMNATGSVFTMQAFIAGAFTQAIPGMILQLVLVPLLVSVMTKAGLNLN